MSISNIIEQNTPTETVDRYHIAKTIQKLVNDHRKKLYFSQNPNIEKRLSIEEVKQKLGLEIPIQYSGESKLICTQVSAECFTANGTKKSSHAFYTTPKSMIRSI